MESNPAAYPENGPRRLALDRTPEQRGYDRADAPNDGCERPIDIENVFRKMLEPIIQAEESTEI